jgi:L-seryl-tRNA(Ser) seleniumtransferase
MRRNPLYRALRVDKMTLAALDAVLLSHASGRAKEELPVLRMLSAGAPEIRARALLLAAALRAELPGTEVEVVVGESAVGGGAAPTLGLPTALVAIRHPERAPDAIAALLRRASPPVIARVADERLLLDLRTVFPEQEPLLRSALQAALGPGR